MPRPSHWHELIGGLVTFAALVVAALGILIFARPGALHGDLMTLYAPTSAARGIVAGNSEVWLAGLKVGRVKEIHFAPASVDSSRRLLMVLEVLAQYRPQIRRDASVQVRAGGSFIGAPVVAIDVSSPDSPPVVSGDTLRLEPQLDVEGITGQFAGATQELPGLLANVRMLSQQLTGTAGTVGAFLSGEANPQVDVLMRRADRLTAGATGGRGTLGLAFGGRDAVMARVTQARARADSVRALVASTRTSLGRFRRDTSLMTTVTDVRNEVAITRALLAEPRGTAGRALADRAAFLELDTLEKQLSDLIADIKARPLRYVVF